MKISNSNVVIVGGSSGIGLELARRFESMGATIIVTGRSSAEFDRSGKAAGLEFLELDVTRRDSVDQFFTEIAQRSLAIDVFVFNAGIMTAEDLVAHDWNPGVAHGIVSVNISGFLNVVGPAIELLRKLPASTLMVTTSSLAFVPRASFPTYCATKAFLHSWLQSARYQFAGSGLRVLELAPPYVRTTLTGDHQLTDPRAMPLDAFIDEVMEIIGTEVGADECDSGEVIVDAVKADRAAIAGPTYVDVFNRINPPR